MEHGMIDEKFNSRVLEDFVRGPDVWAKWDAARRLMAAKQMQSAASTQSFQASFQELGKAAVTDRGTNQLLAIALIVRISELVKGELRKTAGDILAESLRKSIDGIWTISEAKKLPLESKPSEIRENIALALSYASGPWLEPYLIEALAREEKSSRCRLELTRQLSRRDPHVSHWFNKLSSFSWIDVWNVETADRIGRLRELTIAMAMILREQRNTVVVDEESGPALAKMMQEIAPSSYRTAHRAKLADTALAIIDLLDELVAIEFTLITDPEAYSPLGIIVRWWQSSSYPSGVVDGLQGIVRKLSSAIRLRARLGQKSESLVLRLRQALGGSDAASTALKHIAETESGLTPEIDDWLRGRERGISNTSAAITSLLSGASTPMLTQAIAPLLLDCLDATMASTQHPDSTLAGHLRRICGRIQALAAELKLRPVGIVGEVVEFNPSAHRTVSGAIPSEPSVRLRRPMVVRLRDDGSQDVIERALVEEGSRGQEAN
jgi:hypothetical protein